jgi:hypothetical protein
VSKIKRGVKIGHSEGKKRVNRKEGLWVDQCNKGRVEGIEGSGTIMKGRSSMITKVK